MQSPRYVRDALRRLAPLALLAGAWLTVPAAHAACSARAESNACPVRAGDVVVFDRCFGAPAFGEGAGRPTPFGSQACDALRDTNRALAGLGSGVQNFQRSVERDMQDFVRVTTEGAIDRESVQMLQSALNTTREIQGEVDQFLRDRQCGSPAALDALNRKFVDAANLVREAGEVGALGLQAADQLKPVGNHALAIGNELARLGQLAAQRGPEAEREFRALERATQQIIANVGALASSDVVGALNAGGALVTTVGPFVGACAGCASALGGSVSSLGAGGAATAGGGSACPATAGTSCVLPAVAIPAGLAGGAVMATLSSGPCGEVSAGLSRMNEYLTTIRNFVDGTAKLAGSLARAATEAGNASQALARLAGQLGEDAQPPIARIQQSLAAMQGPIDSAANVIEQRMAPRVSRIAENFVQTLARDTQQLQVCFNRTVTLFALLGDDTLEAVRLLAQGSTQAVDAGRVLANIQNQTADAVAAAGRAAQTEWQSASETQARLHRRIWGVAPGVFDPLRTGAHLTALAGDPNEVRDIAGDSGALALRVAQLPERAAESAKRAFLDQDRLRIAKTGYGGAGDAAKGAVRKLAIARARQQALERNPGRAGGLMPALNAAVQPAPPLPAIQRVRLAPPTLPPRAGGVAPTIR